MLAFLLLLYVLRANLYDIPVAVFVIAWACTFAKAFIRVTGIITEVFKIVDRGNNTGKL